MERIGVHARCIVFQYMARKECFLSALKAERNINIEIIAQACDRGGKSDFQRVFIAGTSAHERV